MPGEGCPVNSTRLAKLRVCNAAKLRRRTVEQTFAAFLPIKGAANLVVQRTSDRAQEVQVSMVYILKVQDHCWVYAHQEVQSCLQHLPQYISSAVLLLNQLVLQALERHKWLSTQWCI